MSTAVRWFALIAVLAVAGCGGGELQTGVGSGGSGAPMSVGIVTGFGSVIVNGEHFDESGATVLIDERPDRPTPATVAAIRLGTRVELQHRDRRITTATVGSVLIGPVSSVGGSGFVALEQTVRVNADPARPTVFDGFTALIDLAAGAVVEVHGEPTPSGEILATRVQLRQTALNVVRLAGTASDVQGRSFAIGRLAVNGADASIVPAHAELKDGDRVVAWTDVPYGGGPLVAKVVRVGGITLPSDNAPLTLEGVIVAHQSAASFRVGGVRVDAGAAGFVGGTAADLANGRSVRIRGTVTAGVLSATTVEFLATMQVEAHLTGPITNFVDAGSLFRIRDAQVRVTPQTTYVGGSANNLGTGVPVRLVGPLVNGTVEASTLEFLAVPAGTQRVVLGSVTTPSSIAPDGSRTFRLDGFAEEVRTTADTTYRNGVAGDIAVGRQLRVTGTAQGSQLVAEEVEFMDSPANPPTFDIDGIASDVRADSVRVNGQQVLLTGSTVYTLDGASTTVASLLNGSRVEIVAIRVADVLTAESVEIRPADGGTASVRGLVSGRASPDVLTFLVGSQRVTASADTQIVPGNRTLADVVNGADVEAQGTVLGGVLTATRIKFR